MEKVIGVRVRGKNLAKLRGELLLSQEEMARAAGMSREGIRRVERSEETGMQTANFRRLAIALNMSVDQLLARIGAGADHADEIDLTPLSQEELRAMKTKVAQELRRRTKGEGGDK